MIREGIRMKIALVFIVVLMIVLPILPFSVTGDGVTLKSRIQMFLSFSLSAVNFLLSMLTVFLACGALSNEIREKHVHLIAVKPIPRWQFVTGKWLGILILNLGLLTGSGLIVYGFAQYLRTRPAVSEVDADGVEQEVFTARAGVRLRAPEDEVERALEGRIRQLQAEGRFAATGEDISDRFRAELRRELRVERLSVPPNRGYQVFLFKNLLVDRSPGNVLYIRYKGTAGIPKDYIWHLIWLAGDPTEPTNVVQFVRKDPSDRYSTVPIPADCVNDEGILRLEIHNLDPAVPLVLEGTEGGMELLYGLGGFGWNLFRGLVLVAFRLMLLAAIGLLMSSFLSFPVACMASLLVFFVAISFGFLQTAMDFGATDPGGIEPWGMIGPPVRALVAGFMWLVPNLSRFNPIPTIVDGRVVTLMWIIYGFLELIVMRTLLFGFVACVIFTKRELARVIV